MKEKAKHIYLEDAKVVWNSGKIEPEKFRDATILITGATGLIGASLVRSFIVANRENALNLKLILLIRNTEKAYRLFGKCEEIELVQCDITQIPSVESGVDYIIHCANPTSSAFFLNHPVETIQTAVEGMQNVLNLARQKKTKGVVFLSTMEVYGFPHKGKKVTEEMLEGFDPANPRNSYPISKQLCESLCCAYAVEYHVPVKILRLTQTFGPGVDYGDGRVFAEFARCALEKRDIVLMTKGETERSYLYTADAVSAILTVLLYGQRGQSYSAANPKTYCSIYKMAQMVAEKHEIQVRIEEQNAAQKGYANTLYMDLDTTKLEQLGWKPKTELAEMFDRMMEAM